MQICTDAASDGDCILFASNLVQFGQFVSEEYILEFPLL